MTTTDDTFRAPATSRRRALFASGSAQVGLLVIIAVFWIIFSSLAPGFLSTFNLFALGRSLGRARTPSRLRRPSLPGAEVRRASAPHETPHRLCVFSAQ